MSESEKKPLQKFDARLPHGLRDRMAAHAAREGRSANAQVVHSIQNELEGMSRAEMSEAIIRIEAGVRDILRILNEKK